jgi:MFS family permease
MPTMALSLLAFLAALVLTGTMPVQQIYWAQTFVAVLIAPFGMDLSYPSSSIILSDAVPRHNQGLAMSLVNVVVNYSISLGLGFAGTGSSSIF